MPGRGLRGIGLCEHACSLLAAEACRAPRARLRICWRGSTAASSAALVAPAGPIASVPTGMPAGICTIDSSESMPLSAFDCTGTPSTGRRGLASGHARQMGRAAGAGDDDFQAARARALRVFEQQVRRAVRRDDARFVARCRGVSSVSAAGCRVSQSDFEPMMMPTSGFMARIVAGARRPWQSRVRGSLGLLSVRSGLRAAHGTAPGDAMRQRPSAARLRRARSSAARGDAQSTLGDFGYRALRTAAAPSCSSRSRHCSMR